MIDNTDNVFEGFAMIFWLCLSNTDIQPIKRFNMFIAIKLTAV